MNYKHVLDIAPLVFNYHCTSPKHDKGCGGLQRSLPQVLILHPLIPHLIQPEPVPSQILGN
jgi:hypothetical protein